jgi:GTP-binding protein
MKFLDQIKIQVQGGKGGNGIISFRREFRVDKGGPDGGDGGHGGSIFFVGDTGLNTLFKLNFLKIIKGNDGEDGKGKNQNGAKGKDIFIKVPIGTIVKSKNKIIVDIIKNKPYLIAQGGRGGKGNAKFKSSKNIVPRLSENGDLGEKLKLELTLKVLADVGFVGKPSSGKSTLLSKISNAKPKIANYSFTTLIPQLGIVNNEKKSYVVADLPGLIEGAALGKGLGHEFLKHIERCKIIAHIIDFGSKNKNPINDYKIINKELKSYSLDLENRKKIIIANKMDLEEFQENLKKFKNKYKNLKIIKISALKEKNINILKNKLYEEILKINEIKFKEKNKEITIELIDDFEIKIPYIGSFDIIGSKIKKIYDRIPLNSYDNLRRFNKKMKSIGL